MPTALFAPAFRFKKTGETNEPLLNFFHKTNRFAKMAQTQREFVDKTRGMAARGDDAAAMRFDLSENFRAVACFTRAFELTRKRAERVVMFVHERDGRVQRGQYRRKAVVRLLTHFCARAKRAIKRLLAC